MQENNEKNHPRSDYQDDNVSVKVVKITQSYTKIINQYI